MGTELFTYKDRGNLFSHQTSWRFHVIVGQKVKIVFDIFHSQRNPDPDAEWAVVVYIECGQILTDYSIRFGESIA